jgi:DNA-binding response OmpR family regulator
MESAAKRASPRDGASAIRRMLVVDDDVNMRRLVSRALRSRSIEVDQAADGEEGFGKALLGAYDAVFLDLEMPKLDGMTVLRRLVSAIPDQFVIASSCRSDHMTRDLCFRAGARVFLAKPFSLADLESSVGV